MLIKGQGFNMSIGIALYHTDNLSGQQAYHLATLFFKIINQNITDISYSDESNVYHSVTLDEIKQAIDAKAVKGFRFYSKDEKNPPWLASFGYTANAQEYFDYIDIQCDTAITENEIVQFLQEAAALAFIPYGVVYTSDNVVDAYEYVMEEGVIAVPSYEQHFLWRDETPVFYGSARYENSMLRMVYPCNLINSKHLKIVIDGKTLEDRIRSDEHFGKLIPTPNNESFIWEVPTEQLEYVNKVCGQAGVLIAWNNQ